MHAHANIAARKDTHARETLSYIAQLHENTRNLEYRNLQAGPPLPHPCLHPPVIEIYVAWACVVLTEIFKMADHKHLYFLVCFFYISQFSASKHARKGTRIDCNALF